MFDYKSTSRIRRKMKTRFAVFRDKVESELAASLYDIVAAEKSKEGFKRQLKKLMLRVPTQPGLADDSDNVPGRLVN